MAAKKHTHKYHRIHDTWACAFPDCTHYMPKNVEHQVMGKMSRCWECDKPFILKEENMKDSEPKCFNCSTVPEDTLDNILSRLK